jgi:hypothetical protein
LELLNNRLKRAGTPTSSAALPAANRRLQGTTGTMAAKAEALPKVFEECQCHEQR